jgi:UDP-hydrolysing UDP-N-acetyl-D-glucosamine 2-epimerase
VNKAARKRLKVAVITGSRAEFGLLTPVMRAVKAHPRLKLQVIAAGSHFLLPARTIREVEAAFPVAARVRMQDSAKSRRTRLDDSAATGRGIAGFARAFASLKPDWVVVLGDRIEAFAAAGAASIAGIAVAHIHGGDRAEGIADEAMRHAITKLAHLHLAATEQSAERIRRMGEAAEHVYNVGSPAIDGLRAIEPMSEAEAKKLGDPGVVVLFHPAGFAEPGEEGERASMLLQAVELCLTGPVLCLAPNHDPGREEIDREMRRWCSGGGVGRAARERPARYSGHLPRERFAALLKRVALRDGLLVGNSSAGLIEAAAIGLRAIDVGERQGGRERPPNVVHLDLPRSNWVIDEGELRAALRRAERRLGEHPYGDGRAGPRIARLLASTDPHDPTLLRKRNAY